MTEIRSGQYTDHDFIQKVWLNNLYENNKWFKAIRRGVYFKHYEKIINRILVKPLTEAKIACLKEDPDVIVGFAVIEGGVILHYVFIKPDWRKLGIAKRIVPPTITTVTHMTQFGFAIKPKNWDFNPFLI